MHDLLLLNGLPTLQNIASQIVILFAVISIGGAVFSYVNGMRGMALSLVLLAIFVLVLYFVIARG